MPAHASPDEPSAWVARWSALVAPGARVLDLACGSGRHTRFFAARGATVTAVDRDLAAAAALAALPGVDARVADLEGAPWPFAGLFFDAVVVTNYLHRPLFPAIVAALAPDGVLVYETFMVGNERFGRPSNPAFLLMPGELLDAVAGLPVLGFEQGEVQRPKPAVMQRVCAVRGDCTRRRIDAP
jgi:SAM-dependent methyltransferase